MYVSRTTPGRRRTSGLWGGCGEGRAGEHRGRGGQWGASVGCMCTLVEGTTPRVSRVD